MKRSVEGRYVWDQTPRVTARYPAGSSPQHSEVVSRRAGGTPAEAAANAAAVLLAVHWSRVDDVLSQAGDLSGKVVVNCSLPMNADDTELVIAHTSSGAEELARKIPAAHVVSAFGTVPRRPHEALPLARRGVDGTRHRLRR